MRSFKKLATLIKEKRVEHPRKYSQSELSKILGYKNGQFISNVERGLCSIPLKMLGKISIVLDINRDHLKRAMLEDFEATMDNYIEKSKNHFDESGEKID